MNVLYYSGDHFAIKLKVHIFVMDIGSFTLYEYYIWYFLDILTHKAGHDSCNELS